MWLVLPSNAGFPVNLLGPLADKNLGDTVTVSASATSTLAVSFASQTPLVCTTGGAYGSVAVTLVAIGPCSIRATQGEREFGRCLPVNQGTIPCTRGPLTMTRLSAITAPQTAGTSFSVTITAQDAGNNTVTGFTGTANLTTTAGTINPTATPAFVERHLDGQCHRHRCGDGTDNQRHRPGEQQSGDQRCL